ncbi:MAG: hypothetical protein HOQ45_09105 [Nocardioidaceae bacterium]|nr:hypothetical protein [Nocardioidaceae bacterium]
MTAHLRLAAASADLDRAATQSNGAVAETSGLSCDDPAALDAAVAAATQDFSDARTSAKAAHRPLGVLVSAKRHEAKTEIEQSRTALKALRTQLKDADGKEQVKAARAAIRDEHRDIAHARNLLDSKREVLREVKADRAAARAALASARTHLAEVQAFQDACTDPEPPTAA